MYRASRKAKRPFKPPARVGETQGNGEDKKSPAAGHSKSSRVQEDTEELKKKDAELDEKIKQLNEKGYRPEELKDYIDLLHKYNEIKDVAQLFMGRIAIYDGLPNRDIAQRYNAPKSD